MKRYLIVGGLLAVLIAAGFFLPTQVMEWQDQQRIGNTETEEVQEVVLREQATMTLLQRILLMRVKDAEVDALQLVNGKNYTVDDIAEQVRRELRTLEEMGILRELVSDDPLFVDASVLFYVDLVNTENSAMIWSGEVLSKNGRLEFQLDDESGKIIGISQHYYENYEGDFDGAFDGNMNMQVSGNELIAESPEPLNHDGLIDLATRWGEYLGCSVTDAGYYNFENFVSGSEMQERYRLEVNELIEKGYSEEEACWMVEYAWGIPEDWRIWQGRKAILSDKEAEVEYIIRSTWGTAVYIYCT